LALQFRELCDKITALNVQSPKIERKDHSWPWKRTAPIKLGQKRSGDASFRGDSDDVSGKLQEALGDPQSIITDVPQDEVDEEIEHLVQDRKGGSLDPIFRGGFGELGNHGSRS
jgi:hypothetical protein